MEVNDKNKLNVLDFVSEYDRAQVNRALAFKELTSSTFRLPNCLEVQVLGARNLRSMDSNGLSDPYYTVQVRKQSINSDTIVKTLNPSFPARIEQFYVDDPSAVVSVHIRDEDVLRPSDFLGQWNTTAKWLLINPKKCKYVEWEMLTEEDRRQGWVGFWAPLVDEHFRSEGMCGDVHVRLRWVYNPALPDARPGERRESQTPIQQLNQLRHEIRQRLGDLERIFDILKHIPVLLDCEGMFVLNDTKLSIHDVIFGRRREADNAVKKLMVKHRENVEKRQNSLMKDYPRSLDVKETVVTPREENKVVVDKTVVTAPPMDHITAVETPWRGVLYKEKGVLPLESPAATTSTSTTTATTATPPVTAPVMPPGATTVPMQQDGIDEVTITSVDPTNPTLPKNFDLTIDTKKGTGAMGATPVMVSEKPSTVPSTASPKVVPYNYAPTVKTTSSSKLTSVKKSSDNLVANKDVLTAEEREQFERDRDREHQREMETGSGVTTVNTAGTNTSWFQPAPPAPMATAEQDLQKTIVSELGSGDKLNAVYPEALVSSAPSGDKGYVRGELAGVRQKDLGYNESVYLGAEEDDEAAEQRNEDRFNDDEREYDQDGREFVKIRPIVWRKQFLARHGDPGLNVYKFLERLIRGLVPKLAADVRLQKALAGSTIKSLLKGELTSTDSSKAAAKSAPPEPGARDHGIKGVAQKVAGGVKGVAHTVKDQAKLMENKILHRSQNSPLRSDSTRAVTGSLEGVDSKGYPYVREGDEFEGSSPKSEPASRPVQGQDADFNKSALVIAGGLEAVWQGRHRITSLFRRWKPWHVEIKGDTIFYHKSPPTMMTLSATDAAWYTLDLTWIQDIYLTDSHREFNNELVLRFIQDDNTLHFRLPNRTTTPSLQEWLTAFRKVQQVQQERSRLGSLIAPSESPKVRSTVASTQTTWPGEDIQPQPRSRGSSLATRDINLVPQGKKEITPVTSPTGSSTPFVQQQPDTSYGQQPPLSSNLTKMPIPAQLSEKDQILSGTSKPVQEIELKVPSQSRTDVVAPGSLDKMKQQQQMPGVTTTGDITTDPSLSHSVAQS